MANVTVNTFLYSGYNYGGSTATVRLYASDLWTDSAGNPHIGGSHLGWYQDISCVVSGVTVTIPQFVTQSTLDSIDNPTVTITAVLYDHLGARRQVLFSGWSIPTTTPITYAALRIFNLANSLVQAPDFYLTRQETIDLFNSLVALASQGVIPEIPAGVINGVNGTFTLSQTPVAGTLELFLNGLLQQNGVDYTLSGSTITHNLPPQPGDWLFAVYRTASGIIGNVADASGTTEGLVRLSVPPILATDPVVPGNNDPRVIDVSSYASFAAALTAIGATPTTFNIHTAITGVATATIPSTVTLRFLQGGSLSITTGQTLTINGPIIADPVKIFNNAVAGQGTISLAGNGGLVEVYPQWWGAVADRVGTTGTDSGPAVQAAIVAMETRTVPGVLKITGQFLVKNTTPNSTVLLISKAIVLEGAGGTTSGLYAGADTPITTDIVTYKPSTHPGNENFTVRDMVIGSADVTPGGAGAYVATGNPSARHALVLDISLGVGNITIRYFHIENTKLLPNFGNGAGAGNYGLITLGTSVHGSPAQSYIGPNNLIFNGLFMAAVGDTVTIEGNTFMVFNDIAVSQVTGATSLAILRNNITLRKGVSIGEGLGMSFTGNVVELVEPDSTGSAGACVDIAGPVIGGEIHTNEITCLAPSPAFHGLQIQSGSVNLDVDKNSFRVDATKFGINHFLSETLLGRNTFTAGGTIQTTAVLTNQLEPKIYGFTTMPAAGQGFATNLSLVGAGRYIDTGVSYLNLTGRQTILDLQDTANTAGYLFQESTLLTGDLLYFGSTHATTARRRWIRLFNDTALGGLSFGTNAIDRITIDSAGVITTSPLLAHIEGAALTVSANVITPTHSIHQVGAGLIKTITVPAGFASGTIALVPTAAFTYDATGNILGTGTAVVGRTMFATLSSSTGKFSMSY